MWPFDKKNPEDADTLSSLNPLFQDLYATCEVRTVDNGLLFVGRIIDADLDTITLVDASGEALPAVIYGTRVKLSVYSDGLIRRYAGIVVGNGEWIWKVGDLLTMEAAERRDTFRQIVNVPALLIQQPKDAEDPAAPEPAAPPDPFPCTIIDISQGGTQLYCWKEFLPDDRLRLSKIQLLPQQPVFTLNAVVRWARESHRGGYRYGCEFYDMSRRLESALIQSIFAAQRHEYQTRRRKLEQSES